ncbi:unnamed protein product [Polarella glacialis]|uniref:Ubiquitin-like domain-containing protein n=1 Tax=Polarella glacialis TaxID=89957 RepID=A0A813DFS5_POLGL|nr:unnamed protein product [Polarella glacialis]
MSYELCVKSRAQQILVLRVEETDTILDLKKQIQGQIGTPVQDQQPLYFNGQELDDESATLLEYNILADDCPGGPVVQLGSSAGESSFDLECLLPGGRRLKEHVTVDTTVAQLKGRLTSEVGIPYLCMKLSAGLEELRDPFTLRQYRLAGDSRIEVSTTRPLYAGPAAA